MPDITTREYLDPGALAHFQLRKDPFDDGHDPMDIWLSPELQAIESFLRSAIVQRQMVALVGEPYAGKTTLLRRLFAWAHATNKVAPILAASLDRRRITANALAIAVLRDLTGQDTSSMGHEARSEKLRRTLADQDRQGQFPWLVIDEAHLLTPNGLLALKQIWDSHTLWRQLGVLLVGQLPLKHRLLNDPEVREVTGRIRLIELPTIHSQAASYMGWRFSRVGADISETFEPAAIELLAKRAEYPGWLNNLAIRSMLVARELGERRVTTACVGRA